MAEQENILEPIKSQPLEKRAPLYAAEQEKLVRQIPEAETDVQLKKEQRDIAAKEAGLTRGQEMTAAQEKELAAGAEKINQYKLPEFKPTQDDLMSYAQLGSTIATLGLLLGNGGKYSSKAALASMTGMLNGWRQGRKDLYERELKNFEKETQRLTAMRKDLQADLDRAMKLWPTKRAEAIALAETAAYKAGSQSVFASMVKAGNLKGLNGLLESAKKADEKQLEIKMRLEEKAKEAAATAEYRKAMLAQRGQGGQRSASQQQFIAQRAVTALRGAASVAESIMKLPEYSNAGVLPSMQTKDGMMNAVRNAGARKLSSTEAKAIDTLYSGVSRYLAAIEASGTATGLTVLAGQLEKIKPVLGDKVQDVALKLADMRRISTEAIEAMIESGLLPEQQGKAAQEQVLRMKKAIPFTTDDVVNAIAGQKRSIGEAAGEVAERGRLSEAQRQRRQELEEKERTQ